MDDEELSDNFSDFASSNSQVIISVNMISVGWDDPTVECVLLACSTKILRKYIQAVGRGLRPCQSISKSKCLVIDCGGNIREHGLITDTRNYIFKPIISEKADNHIEKIKRSEKQHVKQAMLPVFDKINTYYDIFINRQYRLEKDLIDDLKTILKKIGWFYYRQNSGILKEGDRWVHFTDKKGLPDICFYFQDTVKIYLECKLKIGRCTPDQITTICEMRQHKIPVFFIVEPIDFFDVLEYISENCIIETTEEGEKMIKLSSNFHKLSIKQLMYFRKFIGERYERYFK